MARPRDLPGGVFVAMAGGTPAGIAALLIGLQPILTVVIARGWFGERVVPRQGLGFALGLGGVWLVRFTPEFIFALGRSVIVLSVGAISLFYWLLRHGAAANIARLFFLVPASTAVMAALMFGETISRTLASVHSPAGECTSLVECSVPPNHTVNRMRRFMSSTWRPSARRAAQRHRWVAEQAAMLFSLSPKKEAACLPTNWPN